MRGGIRRTKIKTCGVRGVDKGKQGATGGRAPALGGPLGGSAGTPVSVCAGPSSDQKGATVYLATLSLVGLWFFQWCALFATCLQPFSGDGSCASASVPGG